MVRWLRILIGTVRAAVRTHRELALENLALRQQLAVWKVRRPRLRLRAMDRTFWVILSRPWKSWQSSLRVVRPETVVGWQRQGFRCCWAWKSRRRRGRPGIEFHPIDGGHFAIEDHCAEIGALTRGFLGRVMPA